MKQNQPDTDSEEEEEEEEVDTSEEEEDEEEDDDEEEDPKDRKLKSSNKLRKENIKKYISQRYKDIHPKKSSKKSKSRHDSSDDDDSDDDPVVNQMLEEYFRHNPSPDKKKKDKKKSKSKRVEVLSETEDDDDDESEDEEDESSEENDEEYDEDEGGKPAKKNNNIVIMLGGNGSEDGYYDNQDNVDNAEIQQSLDYDDDECNSEDEMNLMKEDYQSVEYPKEQMLALMDKKNKKTKNKNNKPPVIEPEELTTVEDEYKDLIDLKKHLSDKLKINPNSKILLRTMTECRESISKLVKKTRTKNAKDYYKLIKVEPKNATSEIDYFKKKLSHKEQKAIMDELKVINDHINIDKPYRLALLQTKLPPSYKATVMQKLNVMRTMESSDGEYHKMKSWVDTFMRIPFNLYKSLDVKMSDGVDVCDKFMKHAKQHLDDCVYGLDDAKLQIQQMIGQWITNPGAMGSAIAICGPPGTGKCFAIDTPILMFDGSIKCVQDVVVGDVLMGDDSTPRNVLGLGRGKDEMYDIVSPDGEKYTVNSEHILSLKTPNDEVVDITVKDYLQLTHEQQLNLQGYKTSVEFPSVPISEDPYEMGFHAYTNMHPIPRPYLINSTKTRLRVLEGILEHSSFNYTNNLTLSEHLAEDVVILARSLGLNTTMTPSPMSYANYTVEIHGMDAWEPEMSLKNAIKVIPVGRGDYYGFEIDGNRRFVLGNFTVTHNTSLAKEGISKILGREFAFIALGGTGDSSFLEGHSYTYEGSSWGKIVQILIDSKCMNPVIYFDELDKLSDSARGQEITGILTHLIDKSQNSQFHDKYFSEVEFDLSKCLFIFSYNDENAVNPILRDRMYRIKTKGYDCAEKVVIAKKYMLPKIREQVNFQEGDIVIPDDVLQYIISTPRFTQNEEGVRNLNRCLEIIHTKLNLFRLMHTGIDDAPILGKKADIKVSFPYTVTKKDVDILIHNEENQNQSLLAMYV